MFRNAVIASTAMMASSALAQGTAHVVNACKYDVYMANTPATGGGFDAIDQVLAQGDSYTQTWTELTNGMGWSIKLAKQPSYESNLLQYEYTFHNDGIIWYDLSQVNGNPWDGDWMITATGGDCNPKQQAYRYATDDAYGMQSCPSNSDITVTLCSGEDQADPVVSSIEGSSPAETSQAAATSWSQESSAAATTAAATTTTEANSQPTTTQQGGNWGDWNIGPNGLVGIANKGAQVTPSPTTLVTKQIATTNAGNYDYTVTDVVTEIATAYVTARHEHHPRHRHMPREE